MFKQTKSRSTPEVAAGSMADIAFLLLIFFLVATTMARDKGLLLQLPPNVPPTETPIKERNLFTIRINSNNEFLIEGQRQADLTAIVEQIKAFVLNPTADKSLAEAPDKAIISLKAQRGTKYAAFIASLDHIKEAYYQIYGAKIGMSSDEFRQLDRDNAQQNARYLLARAGVPMNISIAEPD